MKNNIIWSRFRASIKRLWIRFGCWIGRLRMYRNERTDDQIDITILTAISGRVANSGRDSWRLLPESVSPLAPTIAKGKFGQESGSSTISFAEQAIDAAQIKVAEMEQRGNSVFVGIPA